MDGDRYCTLFDPDEIRDVKTRSKHRFGESVFIDATPEEAFAYLGDSRTARVIDPAVVYYRPERLPMGVGIRNHIKARAFGVPLKMISETKVWKPGHLMVIESVSPAKPMKVTATHQFEAREDGVVYTWHMEFVPNALGGGVVAALACRFMRRNARGQQARLKRILETPPEARPPLED